MSADLLREAAALMRQRAACDSPLSLGDYWFSPDAPDLGHLKPLEAEHIASWHPAVALAVADWLDEVADAWRLGTGEGFAALAVARAYLGRES